VASGGGESEEDVSEGVEGSSHGQASFGWNI
jgi:hypothetical protein